MSTHALTCPNCLAPNPSGPDANDEYLCVYCGTRFHRTSAAAPASQPQPIVVSVQSAPASQHSLAAVLVLIVGLVLLVGAGVAFALLSPSEESSSGKPTPAVPTRVSIDAPAQPATVPPRSSVTAPAPPAKKPEPEVPASASFDFHRTQSGYQSSYYALGIVTNTSPFIIDKPKVIAVLLDAQGNELGTDFGFAARDVLGPGESSPIKILIKDPPEHASLRYELAVRKASYVPELVEGLRVEPMEPRPAQFGKHNWEVEGKVHNEGTQGARFVNIEIQALDAEGKLVGLHNTFADAELLAPGASARYSATVTVADAVDHFEFSASGRPPG